MPEVFVLTEREKLIVQAAIEELRNTIRNPVNRPLRDVQQRQASDVYIAVAPTGGIGARVDTFPGNAQCSIYQLLLSNIGTDVGTSQDAELKPVEDFTQRVYNLNPGPISEGSYTPIIKDKWGNWIVGTAPPNDERWLEIKSATLVDGVYYAGFLTEYESTTLGGATQFADDGSTTTPAGGTAVWVAFANSDDSTSSYPAPGFPSNDVYGTPYGFRQLVRYKGRPTGETFTSGGVTAPVYLVEWGVADIMQGGAVSRVPQVFMGEKGFQQGIVVGFTSLGGQESWLPNLEPCQSRGGIPLVGVQLALSNTGNGGVITGTNLPSFIIGVYGKDNADNPGVLHAFAELIGYQSEPGADDSAEPVIFRLHGAANCLYPTNGLFSIQDGTSGAYYDGVTGTDPVGNLFYGGICYLIGSGGGGGTGTVTNIDITAPAEGITVTGGPVTTSGTFTLALANDLEALEGLTGTGVAVRTGADAWALRTILGTTGQIDVTNGTGVGGDLTIAIAAAYATNFEAAGAVAAGIATHEAATDPHPQYTTAAELASYAQPLDGDLTAIAALATNGLARRTGVDTWVINAVGAASGTDILDRDAADARYATSSITLVGDVTGSGASPITTTIAANAVVTSTINNNAVTYAKIQTVAASRLLGNATTSTAACAEIALASGLRFNGGNLEVAPNGITLAMMATVATATLLGRTTSGTGNVESLSASQSRTVLGLGTAALKNTATSGNNVPLLDGANFWSAAQTFTNSSGIKIEDTDASNTLGLIVGSDLTANRTLTITTGDASRTLTMTGNATISGTNTGDQTITLTGNVTGSGTGSFATTIASNAVTLAMMATVATSTFLGRTTAATGNVEALTVAQAKALLDLSGTNTGDQTITLSGDVSGSGTSGITTVLANSGVSAGDYKGVTVNAKGLVTVGLGTTVTGLSAAGTTQGTATAVTGNFALQEVTTVGSGQGVKLPTATAAIEMTVTNRGANTLLVYPASSGTIDGGSANAAVSVPVNGVVRFIGTSATNWYSLRGMTFNSTTPTSLGTGAVGTSLDAARSDHVHPAADLSGSQATGTLAAARFPALTGDVTTVAGALGTTIGSNKVTLAMMAQVATATFLGRTTAATGNVEALTISQAQSLLGVSGTNTGDQTITLTGAVTGSGTGSFATTLANFDAAKMTTGTVATARLGSGTAAASNRLRGDQTWGLDTPHGARVTNGATQSIPNATNTALTWNTENFNTDSIHSNATNPTRFTIPTGMAGKWVIGGFVAWDGAAGTSAAGGRSIWIYLNTTTILALIERTSDATTPSCRLTLATAVKLAAGDILELYAFQTSGAAINVIVGCSFWCYYLGPDT